MGSAALWARLLLPGTAEPLGNLLVLSGQTYSLGCLRSKSHNNYVKDRYRGEDCACNSTEAT